MENKTLFDDLSEGLSRMVDVIDQQAETVRAISEVFESMGTTNICVMLGYNNADVAMEFISKFKKINQANATRIISAINAYAPDDKKQGLLAAVESRLI